MPTLEELQAKATELGIEFDEKVTEDELSAKIKEAETNNDPEYLKSEAKKAFEARDKAKKAKLAAESKLKDAEAKLKDQMSNTVDKAEYEDLKKQLQEVRAKQLETEEEEEKRRFEKASELEKVKISKDKEMDKLRKDFEDQLAAMKKVDSDRKSELEKERGLTKVLRVKSLENEILIAAEKNNALRPNQIAKLLRDDFEWDESLGKYIHNEFDAKGKLVDYHEVDIYVEEFLKKEENDNLVKSEVNTTSTSHKRGEGPNIVVNKDDKGYKPTGTYNPKDPVLLFEARKEGIAVEDLIKRKEMRDKILQKRADEMKKK